MTNLRMNNTSGWTDDSVTAMLKENYALKDALGAVLDHLFPNGHPPSLLRGCDPVWQQVSSALYGEEK